MSTRNAAYNSLVFLCHYAYSVYLLVISHNFVLRNGTLYQIRGNLNNSDRRGIISAK